MKPLFPLSVIGLSLMLTGCGKNLPPAAEVNVPYTSQAPTGDWSEPWQNACEETSVYMVSSFYAGDDIKRDEAVKKIREIFATKEKKLMVSKDESLETIVEIIKALELPWQAKIVYDPTIDDLKTELAAGRPIIVPVYAPYLSSRYKAKEGADYHVVVLIGYDDTTSEFIINDPGTSSGEGLRVSYDTLQHAIHDLDPKNYTAGKKAVLFTEPQTEFEWF